MQVCPCSGRKNLPRESGNWLATDFSSNMLEQAQKCGSTRNLTFQQADATDLPFERRSFDAVVISNCLHIMPQPDQALKEIHRVLKPAGFLLAPTFVYEPGYSKARIGFLERIGFRTYNKWTAKAYVTYIEAHGFCTETAPIIPGSPASECVYIGRASMEENRSNGHEGVPGQKWVKSFFLFLHETNSSK